MKINWSYEMSWHGEQVTLSSFVGKIPVSITCQDDEITFVFSDGTAFNLFHYQDCHERVFIEDVNGDWNDLIGHPLLVAEERTSEEGEPLSEGDEYFLWTFYTFRGIGGSVDVRWYGASKGFYYIEVDLAVAEGVVL